MKTIDCYFDFCELYEEAEGGWQGWFHPVFATVVNEETGEYIEIILGGQVSGNTGFFDGDVHNLSKSWVGSIPTWKRIWGPDDAEAWAKECCCSPEDYDPDEEVANEVSMWYSDGRFDEDIEALKQNIIEFAKAEGYNEVEFV